MICNIICYSLNIRHLLKIISYNLIGISFPFICCFIAIYRFSRDIKDCIGCNIIENGI